MFPKDDSTRESNTRHETQEEMLSVKCSMPRRPQINRAKHLANAGFFSDSAACKLVRRQSTHESDHGIKRIECGPGCERGEDGVAVKARNVVKQQGDAAISLLEDAAELAKSVETGKGNRIDVTA